MAHMPPVQQEPGPSTTGQTPHVKIASFTLPPGVKGDIKGELVVCIESLHWNYRKPPQQVQVRLRWWGGTVDTVVPFHSTRGAGAAFPVTCGPRYLSRYLKDMGNLVVSVEECPSGRTVGTISIAVSQLDVGKPIEASVPCYGAQEQLLATADVSMCVHYTQLMSSFEINEHLASTDKQLPLYPVAGVQCERHKQRQTTAGQEKSAQAAMTAAGKENTPGISNQSGPCCGTRRDFLHQQPQTVKAAAEPTRTSAEAASGPAQQQVLSVMPLVPAPAAAEHSITAATATGPQPGPLLDIIHRAEQLKMAMQQAASRGISLGLPCALPGAASILAPPGSNLAGPPSSFSGVVSRLAGYCTTAAGPQMCPQQQQLALPASQQPRPEGPAPWLPGIAALASGAAAAAAFPANAASSAALEAVQACLHGPTAANGTLALPQPAAAATTSASAGRHLADMIAGAAPGPIAMSAVSQQQQHQLSPLAAALLQLPAHSSGSRDDASSDNADEASCSSSSSTSSDSSQVTELEDLEELEELLLQELFRESGSPKASPLKKNKHSSQQEQQADHQTGQPQAPAPSATAAAEVAAQKLSPGHVASTQGRGALAARSLQQPGHSVSSPDAAAAGTAAASAAETSSKPVGPHLAVAITCAEGIVTSRDSVPEALTAVIKCGGRNTHLDITQLLHQQPSSSSEAPVPTAVVTGPSSLLGPVLATDSPCLAVEVWSGQPPNSAAVADPAAGQLLGIVRVPLEAAAAVAAAAAAGGDLPSLASGTYPVYDLLRGRYAGSITLSVCLAAAFPDADQQDSPAAAAEEAAGPDVLAVQHVIDVTLHSAIALPDGRELESRGQAVPESRFMKYSFPGEEPLFTQEVDCVSTPVFSAHAQHTVMLPPDQDISECLLEGDAQEHMSFEVYNKWQDDTDTLVASGTLPLAHVLELSQHNHPATAQSSHNMKTFLVPLQLAQGTAEAAVQPPERAVLLQVTISYSAENCYTLDLDDEVAYNDSTSDADSDNSSGAEDHSKLAAVDESATPSAAAAAAAGMVAAVESEKCCEQADHLAVGPEAGLVPAALLDGRGGRTETGALGSIRSAATAAAAEAAFDAERYPQKVAAGMVGPRTDMAVEASRNDPAAVGEQQQQQLQSVDQDSCGCRQNMSNGQGSEASVLQQQRSQGMEPLQDASTAGQVASDILSAQEQQQQQKQGLSAEICVEIIRACGLQAAVIEAERCLGGSSSLLGRARHLGPHPYVTMELPASSSDKRLPTIKTPFQAQTFCPQFHYKQLIPLKLDGSTVTTLATQDCNIKLWHHCSRSQAVAAALSRGHSSSWVMEGQQQVQLGSARLPLQGLLVKPQGIRCWIVLSSQLGIPVGAVQVAAYFSHIGGHPLEQCAANNAPAQRYPQLLQLLPATPSTAQLQTLLTHPALGFQGQLVAVSIHIEELLLPSGDDVVLERPRIANYVATYKLPGREREESTQSKANSGQRSSSNLLAQTWHVDWQYCGRHWATADWKLSKALVSYPLLITVHKQETSRFGSSSSRPGSRSDGQQQQQVMVPVGSVEVHLSPLLHLRPGAQRPSCRWLSGVYAVVHPMAKNLGNTRVKLKILLELQPADPPRAEDVRGTATWWEISGPLATGAPVAAAAEVAAAQQQAAAAGVMAAGSQPEEQQLIQLQQEPFGTAGGPIAAAAAAAGVMAADKNTEQPQQRSVKLMLESNAAQQQPEAGLSRRGPQLQQLQRVEELPPVTSPPQQQQEQQRLRLTRTATGTAQAAAAATQEPGHAAVDQQTSSQRAQPAMANMFNVADLYVSTPPTTTTAAAVLAAAAEEVVRPVPRARFRAEVSHVSAPASIAASRSSSPGPAAAAAAEVGQRPSRMMQNQQQQQQQHDLRHLQQHQTLEPAVTEARSLQQQQQQQEHMPMSVLEHAQEQAFILSPQQRQQEQTLPSQQQQQDSRMLALHSCQQQELALAPQQQQQQHTLGLTDVRVCIEAALNHELSALPTDEPSTACVYVQYDWRPTADSAEDDVTVVTTPLVAAAVGPLRQTATAKWFHCGHLPLQLGTATAAAGGEGDSEQLLLLQVWLRILTAEAAAALPPLYAGIAAAPASDDVLLGVAVLDLTAIHVLGSVEGWYNICDEQQQLKGQIKVNLTPVQQQMVPRPRSQPEPLGLLQRQLAPSPAALQLEQPNATDLGDKVIAPQADNVLQDGSGSSGPLAVQLDGNSCSCNSGDSAAEALQLPRLDEDTSDEVSSAAAVPHGNGSILNSAAAAEAHSDIELQVHEPQHLVPCQHDTAQDQGGFSDVEGATVTDELLETLWASLKELDELSAALAERVRPQTPGAVQEDSNSSRAVPAQSQQQRHHQDQQQDLLHTPYKALQALQQQQNHQQQQEQQQQQQPRLTAQISLTAAPPTVLLAPNNVAKSACHHSSSTISSKPSANSANSGNSPGQLPPPAPLQAAAAMSAAAAAAARAAALAHVQTLSEDEDYLVSGAAVTDSDTDTEELMGRVDWSMAQNSDDYDVPAGPPAPSRSAASQPATAAASDTFHPEPLNKEDWMFDFARPSASTAAAAAASTSGPVNPAQMSQAAAAAQQVAATERLARMAEASAAAAAARAAAADRAAAHAAAGHLAGGDAAAAGSSDVWEHLAAVEEEEDQRQQQQRSQQQEQQQQQVHDPRELPEVLEQRLDLLLATFQASINPVPANRARAAAAAAEGSDPAAGAGDQAVRGWRDGFSDPGDDDDDHDFLPAERVVHQAGSEAGTSAVGFANCLPPILDDFVLEYSDGPRRVPAAAAPAEVAPAAVAVGSQPRSAAAPRAAEAAVVMWDREGDDDVDESAFVLPERVNHVPTSNSSSSGRRVGFSNALPPVQDGSELQYSDQRAAASSTGQQQQRWPAAAITATVHTTSRSVNHPGMHPAAAAAAAAAVEAAAHVDEAAAAAMPGSSSGSGMVPVMSGLSAAAVDDMFSISKRPRPNSGHNSSGSSSAVQHARQVNASARLNTAHQQQQQSSAAGNSSRSGGSSSSGTMQSPAQRPTASASTVGSTEFVPVLGRHTAAGLDDMFSFSKRSSSSSRTAPTSSGIKHPYM